MIRLWRFSVEYIPARYRQWGRRSYRASTALHLGAVQLRWRR